MENQENIAKIGPKDVFLQLLNIAVFYVSVVSFIALWWQYINILVPDPLKFYYQSILDSILWTTSILIVAFPVYVGSSWLVGNDFAAMPLKRESKFRKWLIYFTLFASAVTIIIDVISLIYNFQKGDLTLHFFLKIFVILAVAGAVFGYYYWELKRSGDEKERRISKMLAYAVMALVISSVVLSYVIIGTPSAQRQYRFDERRIGDLQSIQSTIVYSYWQQKGKLPATLDDLKDDVSGFVPPRDPNTDEQYGYKVIDTVTFELCADFAAPTESWMSKGADARPYADPYEQNWKHEKGRTCFTRKIDPELYRVKEPMPQALPVIK